MDIQLIEKSARIHVPSIAKDFEKQWRSATPKMLEDDEVIVPSVCCEQGAWYVVLTVLKRDRSKDNNTTPHIIKLSKDEGKRGGLI